MDPKADVTRRLSAAAGTGEVLTIVYDGGSQPGSKRDIIVRHLLRSDKVQAVELHTQQVKTFKIGLLSIVARDHPARPHDPEIYRDSRRPKVRGVLSWLRRLFRG